MGRPLAHRGERMGVWAGGCLRGAGCGAQGRALLPRCEPFSLHRPAMVVRAADRRARGGERAQGAGRRGRASEAEAGRCPRSRGCCARGSWLSRSESFTGERNAGGPGSDPPSVRVGLGASGTRHGDPSRGQDSRARGVGEEGPRNRGRRPPSTPFVAPGHLRAGPETRAWPFETSRLRAPCEERVGSRW